MGIPYRFDPLGTLGASRWPDRLTKDLIDGWSLAEPYKTVRGEPVEYDGKVARIQSLSQTPVTVLIVSDGQLTGQGEGYDTQAFNYKPSGADGWNAKFVSTVLRPSGATECTYFDVSGNGRYFNGYDDRATGPRTRFFEAVATYVDGKARVFVNGGWHELPKSGLALYPESGIYARKLKAWAAYPLLEDDEAVARLEILKNL